METALLEGRWTVAEMPQRNANGITTQSLNAITIIHTLSAQVESLPFLDCTCTEVAHKMNAPSCVDVLRSI